MEGVQSVSLVDVNEEGSVHGERFLQAFQEDILVTCEPYPGNRSIVVMDNAQVHMKIMIIAACTAVGVLVIFLPTYPFNYNPIKLVFNVAKTRLRNRHGHGFLLPDVRIGQLFRECLNNCIAPDIAW